MRYTFNRLLYLVPREQLGQYEAMVPNAEEIVQIKEVYNCMISGNITKLVHFSGPAVSAFAQLWSETQSEKPYIEWSVSPKAHERDAVITLALYGICEPPAEWINKFVSRTRYNQTALSLASHALPEERTYNDYSYIDEMESLFLTRELKPRDLLKTRFDKDEDIVLPALSLGEASEPEIEDDY
jgi:hypothetical protein